MDDVKRHSFSMSLRSKVIWYQACVPIYIKTKYSYISDLTAAKIVDISMITLWYLALEK